MTAEQKRLFTEPKPAGKISYELLRPFKLSELPVPTGTLLTIADQIGLSLPEQQLSFDLQDLQSPIIKPSTHDERYRISHQIGQALSLNGLIKPESHEVRYFARSLLAPHFLLKDRADGVFKMRSIRDFAKLALDANMPTLHAIERASDIRNNGAGGGVIAGFSPDRPLQPGFIWTPRGTRLNATQVIDNFEELSQIDGESLKVLLARTEYNGNIGLYRFSSGNSITFKRPSGESETLFQFNLGKRISEAGQHNQEWLFNQGHYLVINIDPLNADWSQVSS